MVARDAQPLFTKEQKEPLTTESISTVEAEVSDSLRHKPSAHPPSVTCRLKSAHDDLPGVRECKETRVTLC